MTDAAEKEDVLQKRETEDGATNKINITDLYEHNLSYLRIQPFKRTYLPK